MQSNYGIPFDMARTTQDDLPVSPLYMRLLWDAVKKAGRNRVADRAGIDPSTVHRNVTEKRLTYTTARKLREAIDEIRLEESRDGAADADLPPWLPPPFFPVLAVEHHQWMEAGAKLLVEKPAEFTRLLRDALGAVSASEANSALAHPLPGRSRK